MNTSEYDKSIGMPDIDKEWIKFEKLQEGILRGYIIESSRNKHRKLFLLQSL